MDEELELLKLKAKAKAKAQRELGQQEPDQFSNQPADVELLDRMKIKNFSNSPEVGAEYLKQKGFETQVVDGNIYAKKPGEKEFKALDPQGQGLGEAAMEFMTNPNWLKKPAPEGVTPIGALKETGKDLLDIPYDVGAGVAQGALTAAGGIGGAMATAPAGGVGAIPGAMAAGGASGAGLEALRQQLGKWSGLPQEISGKDVAISGAIGTASPLLFGAGATGAQIAKSGMAPEIAQQLKSPAGALIKKGFPHFARFSSGVPVDATKTYLNRTGEVKALINEGQDAAANVAEDLSGNLKTQFFSKKREVGKALSENIKGAKNLTRRDDVFDPIEEHIRDLIQKETSQTPSGQAEIQALREAVDNMKTGLPEYITPETVWDLKDQLASLSDVRKISGTYTARFGQNATNAEKAVSNAAKKAHDVANKKLEDVAGVAGKKSEYSKLSKLQEKLEKYFKDPETTERTLLSLDKPSKGAARKTVDALEDAVGDTGIKDQAQLLESYKYYQDPELLPISTGGTTSTSRTGGLSGVFGLAGGLFGEGGRKTGENIGRVVGGPASMKAAMDIPMYLSKKTGAAIPRSVPLLYSPWKDMIKKKENE
jgi:hypothetical protein